MCFQICYESYSDTYLRTFRGNLKVLYSVVKQVKKCLTPKKGAIQYTEMSANFYLSKLRNA
jgi:hypothetical protein